MIEMDSEQKLAKRICEQNGILLDHVPVLAAEIRSHTDALIAAAIEECANQIHVWVSPELENHVRSLTPADARRALELREVMTRLEEARKLWHEDFIEAYNGGTFTELGREILRKRIAELEHRRAELEGEKHG